MTVVGITDDALLCVISPWIVDQMNNINDNKMLKSVFHEMCLHTYNIENNIFHEIKFHLIFHSNGK